jgi:hypothetical protein
VDVDMEGVGSKGKGMPEHGQEGRGGGVGKQREREGRAGLHSRSAGSIRRVPCSLSRTLSLEAKS